MAGVALGAAAQAQTAHSAGSITILGSGFAAPYGTSVDASGNVFVADYNNNAVKKIPYSGGSYGTPVTLGSGFSAPIGVTVDASGNVYVADYNNNAVKEIPYSSGSYGTPVTLGSGFNGPSAVAVDASGNVYVADYNNNAVKKIPYSSGSYGAPVTLGSGFSTPRGVVVDASGNVYVGDTGNSAVKKIPYSSGSYGTPLALGSGFTSPQGVAVDAGGNVYVGDTSNIAVKKITVAPNFQGLGSAPVATSTPLTQTVLFSIVTSGTLPALSNANVVTQGASGLDFTLGTGSTCTGAVTAGQTCTVNVTFTPKAPGQRLGAVSLKNSSGTLIAIAYIGGTGTGPLVDFTTGVETTPYSGMSNPQSIAFDGAGNLYVTNYGTFSVLKYPAGSTTPTTFLSSQNKPFGIAVDGAGNVFVANYGSTSLTEMTAAGVQTTFGSGLNEPQGLAIDGAGTIYVENSGVPNVVKFVNGSTTPTVVATLPTQFGRNIVVDGSGNLFVADSSSGILEIAAGSSTATASATPGVNLPSLGGELGVAVDAAGNVYATPESTVNTQVYEIPASGANAFIIGTSNNTNGIALDASGRLYLANYGGTISVIDRTQAAPLTFPSTSVGATSAAQTVVLENDGNAALTFAPPATGGNPSISTGFSIGNSSTCPQLTSTSNAGTLAPGASCTDVISFAPVATGSINGSLTTTDNLLYVTGSTQTVSLSGTATQAPTTVTLSSSVSPSLNGEAVTFTAAVVPSVSGTAAGTLNFDVAGVSFASTTVPPDTTTATTTALPVGSDAITAVYGGSPTSGGSTSPITTQVVQDFALALVPQPGNPAGSVNQTVVPGHSATFNFTASPVAVPFTFPITLTTTGLPKGATATITPQVITPGANPTSFTVTIQVPLHAELRPLPGFGAKTTVVLALLLLPFSRRLRRRAKGLRPLLLCLVLSLSLAGLGSMTGCGTDTGFFAYPPGTYNLTLTGTATNQGYTLQHNVTYQLTVQ